MTDIADLIHRLRARKSSWLEAIEVMEETASLLEGLAVLRVKMDACDSITSTPGICNQLPVLKGTRVTIARLLAELADSNAPTDLADRFDMDRGLIVGALNQLSTMFSQSMVPDEDHKSESDVH